METLHDYIKWMKNIDFRSVGLTEPDAVVLTTLTYFDYAPLFATGAKTVYLKDMRSRLESGDVKPFITGRDTGALELLRDAANSSRYGELRIVDFVDEFRNDPPFQFSALTFECPGAFRFIAFRGTDSTIAGWKEDFMISFTETEAQKAALCYAENHIDPETVNYISGHSKGGNEALYAACYLSRDLFSAVKRVFLLDSPGCAKEVLDPRLVREIDRKTTRIIPEFDLVGKLFEPEITDTKIVRSSEQLVMQHAPNSWLVDHGELDTVPKCAEASLWITHLVTDWIEELPMEERPVFTDELFSALTADGAAVKVLISPLYLR